jgi:hypothetical protein
MHEPMKTIRQEEMLDLSGQLDLAADKLLKLNEIECARQLSVVANELFNKVNVQLIPPAP